MARSTANRVEPSAGVEDVAERPQRPLDEPYMQSREAFDAATLARYALSEADPPRVHATLRLTDHGPESLGAVGHRDAIGGDPADSLH